VLIYVLHSICSVYVCLVCLVSVFSVCLVCVWTDKNESGWLEEKKRGKVPDFVCENERNCTRGKHMPTPSHNLFLNLLSFSFEENENERDNCVRECEWGIRGDHSHDEETFLYSVRGASNLSDSKTLTNVCRVKERKRERVRVRECRKFKDKVDCGRNVLYVIHTNDLSIGFFESCSFALVSTLLSRFSNSFSFSIFSLKLNFQKAI
jgi:hypothetical protein